MWNVSEIQWHFGARRKLKPIQSISGHQIMWSSTGLNIFYSVHYLQIQTQQRWSQPRSNPSWNTPVSSSGSTLWVSQGPLGLMHSPHIGIWMKLWLGNQHLFSHIQGTGEEHILLFCKWHQVDRSLHRIGGLGVVAILFDERKEGSAPSFSDVSCHPGHVICVTIWGVLSLIILHIAYTHAGSSNSFRFLACSKEKLVLWVLFLPWRNPTLQVLLVISGVPEFSCSNVHAIPYVHCMRVESAIHLAWLELSRKQFFFHVLH